MVTLGKYQLTKTKEGFNLSFSEKLKSFDVSNFVNVTLEVPGDERFPQTINFDSRALGEGKGFDIIFKAI